MKDKKINFRKLIVPVLVWLIGLMMIVIYAPKTVYMNRMVMWGFAVICIGTFLFLYAVYKECDRIGDGLPIFFDTLFPEYPVVEDSNLLMKRLSGFRKSYSDYLSSKHEEENSALQNYASQVMWHSTHLQKRRLMKNDLTLEMDCERRAYSGKENCVRYKEYFDGRYKVNDVYEEISALRTIRKGDRTLKQIRYDEVAHYTLLSMKKTNGYRIICPNCGNESTRENLLDGCDYCGTRFTIEDMENRVDSFGLRHDFQTNASKKEAVRDVVYPWATMVVMLPLIYFGFIGAFVYTPGMNIFAKLAGGIAIAGLMGLLGWGLKSLFLPFTVPLFLLVTHFSRSADRKLIYKHEQEEEKEWMMAQQVRNTDPYFSIQSFFGNAQNKLSAVHYAESELEVNTFSECDMTPFLDKYMDVVDMDCLNMTMDSYQTDEKLQRATVSAQLHLLKYKGNRIKEDKERIRMTLVKDINCKTQAVCGPYVMRCRSCGSNLSLMDGKTCRYCGIEPDWKLFDWVIEEYEIL